MEAKTGWAQPTGRCWCGCGATTRPGAFFVPGHDQFALRAFLVACYEGNVAQLLADHGYTSAPEWSITVAAMEAGSWERCTSCEFSGTADGLRRHRRQVGH